MGRRVNNTQKGNISEVAFMYKEDYDLLVRQMGQLADIWKNLEPLNLRTCTEDSLCHLVLQLQEVVKVIWSLPTHVLEDHMISKKALLQDLRTALIKLLLAQDQIATKGRTPRFYQHLLVCQENLSHAFEIAVDNAWSYRGIKDISQPILPQKELFAHIQKYYTDFLTTQSVLERAKLSSPSTKEGSIEQFEEVYRALNALHIFISKKFIFTYKYSHFQEEAFSTTDQFFINISYLEDQIPRLLELIKTYHSAYYSSPKRTKKISREIVYNLEAIVHSSREVPPALIALLNSPQLHRENRHHLQLIYSAENQ